MRDGLRTALTIACCGALLLAAATRGAHARLFGGPRSPIEVLQCQAVASHNAFLPPTVEISFKVDATQAIRRVDFAIIHDRQTISHAVHIGNFPPGAIIVHLHSSLPREDFENGLPELRCVTDSVRYMDGESWHQ